MLNGVLHRMRCGLWYCAEASSYLVKSAKNMKGEQLGINIDQDKKQL